MKEGLHKEVDLSFDLYEKLKGIEWESYHRIIQLVYSLKQEEMKVKYPPHGYPAIGTPGLQPAGGC